jgi:hypothetical protein
VKKIIKKGVTNLVKDIHLHKRGKRDVNVAIATFQWKTWQERRSSGKRGNCDVNVAIATYIFTNVARVTLTWQLRRSSGKRGKRDVPVENVAIATLTWQLRHTSSQTWQERR